VCAIFEAMGLSGVNRIRTNPVIRNMPADTSGILDRGERKNLKTGYPVSEASCPVLYKKNQQMIVSELTRIKIELIITGPVVFMFTGRFVKIIASAAAIRIKHRAEVIFIGTQ